jgi:poly(3-hydroxybutyrate) depolymerase
MKPKSRFSQCLATLMLICLCVASSAPVLASSDHKGYGPSGIDADIGAWPFANQNDTGSHGSGGQTGTIDKITTAQGVTREYELYVPSSVGTKPGPFALFIYLHGAGGDKTQGTNRFGNRSNSDGFIIASPSGDYQKSWREIYTTDGSTQTYYDSSLIRVILNETIPLYNIDLSNTWIGGYSDGGAMSLRAGTLMSDVFATVTHQTGGWKEDWANASWIARKSMSFYSAVGDGDFGFRQHLEDAHSYFTQAGFEHKLEIIQNTWHEWRDDNQNLFAEWEKNHFLPHNWIRPAISFNQPTPGAQWDAGSNQTVEWWLGCGHPSY